MTDTTVSPADLAAALAEATTEKPAAPRQRAYASDVSLSFFGVMNIIVDLVPAKKSGAVSFTIICPDCDEAHRLDQRYICGTDASHGDGIDPNLPGYASGTSGRGKEVNGTLVRVDEEEISAIKDGQLPLNDLQVTVYPADDVERLTRPNGTAYRLRPKGTLPIYKMLVDLTADRSKAFIGEMNVRGQDKLFRIESWNGVLTVTELARPSEVVEAEHVDATYEGKLLAMATQLADVQTEDFDPAKFANKVKERAAAWEAQKVAEGLAPDAKPGKPKKVKEATATIDLMAALEASLAKAQAAKA
jgi:non-homologous end joining protein Ku